MAKLKISDPGFKDIFFLTQMICWLKNSTLNYNFFDKVNKNNPDDPNLTEEEREMVELVPSLSDTELLEAIETIEDQLKVLLHTHDLGFNNILDEFMKNTYEDADEENYEDDEENTDL